MGKKLSKDATIINELGIHARAAAKITEIAKKAGSHVWIIKNGEKVDASGILEILMLECAKDAKVTVTIDHPEDIDVLNSIIDLIQTGFGE